MKIRKFSSYEELKKVHQNDIEEFPITYMFGRKSDEEVKEELSKIGAKCMAECTSVFGCGDVVRKVDVPKLQALLIQQKKERLESYSNDDILEEAILSEMFNHEYALTYDKDTVVSALGLSSSMLKEERTWKIWGKAEKKCFEESF